MNEEIIKNIGKTLKKKTKLRKNNIKKMYTTVYLVINVIFEGWYYG